MNKRFKIVIITFISILFFTGIGYAGFLFYVKNYIQNAPPDAQLAAGESLYSDCIERGAAESDCQKYLESGIGQALMNSKDKFLRDALNTKIEDKERISGLALYNTIMRQDYDYLTDEEIGVYFGLANNKDDLEAIREMAMGYLLEVPSQNKAIINLQRKIMNNEEAKKDYRFKAFKTVAKYRKPNDIPSLIELMKNYGEISNIKISNSLCNYWPEIKDYVPDLMEEFKNKDNSLALRYNSLNVIKCLAEYHGFTNKNLVKELEIFLDPDNHYVIQSITQSTLNNLTNKDYKIEEKGEGDFLNLMNIK